MVVLLIPGALLLTAVHRAAATDSLAFVTVTSQVLCIVQGDRVCIAELLPSHSDKGAEWRGGSNGTRGLCVL